MIRKLKLFIFMLLLVIPTRIYAYSKYVVASGENIGIEMKSNGIIVIGKYNNLNSNLKVGDKIVSVNDDNNIDINSFTEIVSKYSDDTIKIGYIRNNNYKNMNLKIKDGKTGLYLKDTIVGIGTLTFIDPNSKIFGALGHEIIESSSGILFENKEGNIYDSKVIDIKKSDRGIPGEKNASIDTNNSIGDIDSNTNKGLFGDYYNTINNDNLYEVGDKDTIKLGRAYILTELDNNRVDKYEIEIVKINTRNDTRNIVFKVTDKRLQNIGIVQGMSGSPIIQDKYIVGAVTHVVVDNPNKGYGILITNMLEEAEKKDE